MKFYENGTLLDYLRNHNDAELPWKMKLGILKDIAAGVHHLHREHVIHRDLAARNVLLTSNMRAVVSDFGFARILQRGALVSKTQSNIGPVKHMAPESLADRIYSEKSDVYAFGITAWEVITNGEEPWPGLDTIGVVVKVTQGFKLVIPVDCLPPLTRLMDQCWESNPVHRPPFQEIYTRIETMEKELTSDYMTM